MYVYEYIYIYVIICVCLSTRVPERMTTLQRRNVPSWCVLSDLLPPNPHPEVQGRPTHSHNIHDVHQITRVWYALVCQQTTSVGQKLTLLARGSWIVPNVSVIVSARHNVSRVRHPCLNRFIAAENSRISGLNRAYKTHVQYWWVLGLFLYDNTHSVHK